MPLTESTKGAATDAAAALSAAVVDADAIDSHSLEILLGYNARRVALHIIERFVTEMAPFGLRPVGFSVLSLVNHNPGITARQLCAQLALLPPNIVGLLTQLQERNLIERKPHPTDGRAQGLYCTDNGRNLAFEAEIKAQHLEIEASKSLTRAERSTLIRLLQKVYKP